MLRYEVPFLVARSYVFPHFILMTCAFWCILKMCHFRATNIAKNNSTGVAAPVESNVEVGVVSLVFVA